MKRSFSIIAGLFALLAVSCTQEKFENPAAGEVTVSFAAELPAGVATKAYGEAENVDALTYFVYDAGQTVLLNTGNATVTNGVANVHLTLVKGKSYDILFWAQSSKATAYTVENQTLTVHYDALSSNEDKNDAFYKFETFNITGPLSTKVQLYRPFAQINLGTNDPNNADANYFPTHSEMTVTLPTTLNLATNAVGEETAEAVYAKSEVAEGEFPVEGYNYLAMNYVLVGEDQTTADFVFNLYEDETCHTVTVSNAPVKQNYRTNIYGALLTEGANFEIEIVPGFKEPAFDLPQVYNIDSAEDFADIDFTGKVDNNVEVNLNNDITVDAESQLQQVGSASNVTVNVNGNGNTIISTADSWEDFSWDETGMFPTMSTVFTAAAGTKVTVSDLNFSGTMGAVMLGLYSPASTRQGTIEFNNVTIQNADVANNLDLGVSSAMLIYNKTTILNNVVVTGTKVASLDETVPELYDVIFARYSNTTVNGGEIGTAYVWNVDTYLTVGDGAKIGTITLSRANANNQKKVKVTIKAGATVGTLDLSKYEDGTGIVVNEKMLVVEDGGTLGKIVANGVEYPSIAAFNNRTFVSSPEDLGTAIEEAVKKTDAVVVLPAGEYTVPAAAQGEEITFLGGGKPEDTVINCTSTAGNGNFYGSTVTFENLTIESNGAYMNGFTHVKGATYKNCIINNQLTLYNDGTEPLVFEDCVFNTEKDYNLWTWGSNATFINCVFNCNGKAVLVYGYGESTVTFTKCTFNDNGKDPEIVKAAIETGDDYDAKYTININDCTVNGFDVTEPKKDLGGDTLGTKVWGNKDRMTRDNLNVFINGTEAY